jgi:hypothetical protein
VTPSLCCFPLGRGSVTPSLCCFAAGHGCVTPSLCCFPIGFRNSREFRTELNDRIGSKTSINSITSYNSGIPGNSYQFLLIIQFRNSVWNWMIEWVVKQVSILFHLIILEFRGIPSNSVFVQLRNKKEFRGIPSNSVFVQLRNKKEFRGTAGN